MRGIILGDRYELIEKIGEGGMAEVYKAKCNKLKRFVAVKILKKEFSADQEIVEKFKREATAVATLSDNNIVNIFDVGSQDNIHFLVMEYVDGFTLKDIIRENVRLSYEKTIDFGIQISKALQCAHRNNIIHRDIKPQNILVTKDGLLKVTDFGIAKAPSNATITNTNKVMGSAHYFSPEQAKGSVVDVRTDIYSLGIVMYEMVTGKLPYDADSPVTVALKHIQEQVVPPKQINSSVPESLNRIILKAIEKDANMRYQNIKELLLDLVKIQKDINAEIISTNMDEQYTIMMDPIVIEEKKERINVEKKTPNRKVKRGLIFSLVGLLIVVLGGLAGWVVSSQGTQKITIPNIVGAAEADAQKQIEDLGLKFVVAQEVNSEEEEGTVLEIDPAAGAQVEKNSVVNVKISAGLEKNKMPDLTDLNLTKAKQLIVSSGFSEANITVSEEYNDSIAKDTIISQNPAANEAGNKNTKIKLVVSKGPQFTKVPDLVGKTIAEAENILKNSKLQLGDKTAVTTTDKTLDGKIITQNIEKDTEVKVDQTKINVTYGKFEEEKITVPDFEGWTVGEVKKYKDVVNGNLIIAGLENAKTTDKIAAGQSPAANKEVSAGTTVTVKIVSTGAGAETN